MTIDTKKTEKELIDKLINLEQDLHLKEMEKSYTINDNVKNKLEIELSEIEKRISETKINLTQIDDPKDSQEIRRVLIKALDDIIHRISSVKFDLPISRSQATCFDNHFADIIIYIIESAINQKFYLISTPFLYYTKDENDGIEKNKVITFLKNEINILTDMENVNYIKIQFYFKEFVDRMIELIK